VARGLDNIVLYVDGNLVIGKRDYKTMQGPCAAAAAYGQSCHSSWQAESR
jgi:hypothetical protein